MALDVADGRTWRVLADLPKVSSLEFLDGGQVMVKTDSWLGVYAFDGDRMTRLAARETELGPATAWGGGRVLLASPLDAPEIGAVGGGGGRAFGPARVARPVPCDWRPDGRAVLVYAGGRLVEADLVTRTVRPLLDAAECFAYTADGFAVVRDRSIVLYRWRHGTGDR